MVVCSKCAVEMVEAYLHVPFNRWLDLTVYKEKMLGETYGKAKCYVCPGCGKIELYMDQLDKLKKPGKK